MLVWTRLEFWPMLPERQEVADNAANSRFETVRLMRDMFIGDEGDFCKYGLLRALAGVQPKETDELSLGIVWYRVPESRIKYLDDPKTFRGCDSEEHTSELQSLRHLVCRLLLEKKQKTLQSEPS